MTFRSRPYDPERGENRTPAQKAATDRNFKVFQLRSLATNRWRFTGERSEIFDGLIDAELKALGAKTTAEHNAAVAVRWKKTMAKPDDVPF